MSKSFNYIIVVTWLMIGLSLLGLSTGATHGLLEALGYPNFGNFKLAEFFSSITSIFIFGTAASSLIIGYLVTQNPDSALKAGAAALFAGWVVSDFAGLSNSIGQAVTGDLVWLALVIQSLIWVMAAGFVFAMISWWSGSDG